MTSEFVNLGREGQFNPTEQVWWEVPIKGEPELLLVHAGRTNKAYTEAIAKANAKSGASRRAARGMLSGKMLDETVELDRRLFPRYVIKDWRGIRMRSAPDKDVPFSVEQCESFLRALPDWIVGELSNFAAVAAHFLPEDTPDDAELQEQAGK